MVSRRGSILYSIDSLYHHYLFTCISTGCPDQIVQSVNLILLPNQKTCRKCEDSFGIVSNRDKIYVFG